MCMDTAGTSGDMARTAYQGAGGEEVLAPTTGDWVDDDRMSVEVTE